MLDGVRVQQAAKGLEVRGEDGGRRTRGGRKADFHLEPAGGAGPAPSAHVQLIEARAREAFAGAGRGASADPLGGGGPELELGRG